MENKEFIDYINANLEKIYFSFSKIFELNLDEYHSLIKRVIKDITTDSFYKEMLNIANIAFIFNEEVLVEKKELLTNLELDERQIKEIIVTIPEFLLVQDKSNIFPIYKNNTFKGLAFVINNEYRAYSYSDSNYKLNGLNNLNDCNVNYYNYIVDELLKSLDREDIKERISLIDDASLKDKFIALSRNFSKKNYYFRKM